MIELSAKQIRDKIASGQVTSFDVVQNIFDHIEKTEPKIEAFLELFKERAISQAKSIDQRIAAGEPVGKLAGVPVAVKDNMCTDFGKTSCASKILANFKSPYNATVIERLLAEDAVIIGKCNMDEFAMGSSTENSGVKQTYNPWDTTKVPGGSSGGSAAAVSSEMCFASLGSDTGGSIRQPASFCGVVGLKPTYGRVSRFGLVAFGSSLDQIGPFTRNVEDCALMMNVLAGYDEKDSTSINSDISPVPDYLADIDKPIENLKIGVATKFSSGAAPAVREAVEKAIDFYKQNGAEVIEVDVSHLEYAIATYYMIATAEASSNLARFDGVHYGHRSKDAKNYIEVYTKSRAEGFGAEVKRRIMLGTYALSSGYYDAYYLKALKVRNLIRGDFEKAFEKCDCIMMPVSPVTAFKVGEKTGNPLEMYLADIFTISVNLAGLPGISMPCGFDESNMPIGLQILTPAFTEDKLLRIARMYENNTGWHEKRPDVLGK